MTTRPFHRPGPAERTGRRSVPGRAVTEREWDPEILEEERRAAAAIAPEDREEILPLVGRTRAAVQDLRDAGIDVVSLDRQAIFSVFDRSGPVLAASLAIEQDVWLAERLARMLLHAPARCPEAVAALVSATRRFRAHADFVLVTTQALAVHARASDRELVAPMAEPGFWHEPFDGADTHVPEHPDKRVFWDPDFDGRGTVLEFVLLKIDKPLAGRTAQAVLREVHPPADATWAQANPVRSALTGVARLKRHDLRELVEARLEDPIPGLREGARETIKKLDRDRDRREARA